MIKFISFCDMRPVYQACAAQLKRSLEKVGIADYHFETVPHTEWNCYQAWAYKPQFILWAMDHFKKHDRIVYLDADSVVIQYPELFEKIPDDFDIGVHYKDGRELLGGVIYLKNTDKMLKFVFNWAELCSRMEKAWDQKVLQMLINDDPDIKVYVLPANYCQIFDTMAGGVPVIQQMQASRLTRGIDPNHNPILPG